VFLGTFYWGQAFDPARLWPVRIVAGTTAVTANTATANGTVLFGLDYDNYEANGNIAAVTRTLRTGAYGTPYTLDFAKCRTAKWSGKTDWGFNPRWGVPFNTPFPP